VSYSVDRSVSQSVSQSVSELFSFLLCRSVSQLMSILFYRLVGQSVSSENNEASRPGLLIILTFTSVNVIKSF
jgi:hypothetical protein